ncbi:MAG TPA: DnaJ domain-containing protein [Sphingomicrobium sp.]
MTSDCYAILGVSPTAEDVVIGAAYRALMRHYHPDTNADPTAQARAREITAAYAVLRDPVSRAEYDARRKAADEFWDSDEPPRRPPPMRSAAIASAVLATLLVGAVWTSQSNQPPSASTASPPVKQASTKADQSPAEPPRELEPEARRLEKLAPPVAPPPSEVEADLAPVPAIDAPPVVPRVKPSLTPTQPRVALATPPKAPPKPSTQPISTAVPVPQSNRVATLNRMSSGFFSQSMTHADNSKKTLLVALRDRSEAERKACRSDSCVADAYVRQIRATSAIMESKPGPAK